MVFCKLNQFVNVWYLLGFYGMNSIRLIMLGRGLIGP